jgi:hypothetical protein
MQNSKPVVPAYLARGHSGHLHGQELFGLPGRSHMFKGCYDGLVTNIGYINYMLHSNKHYMLSGD